MQIKFRIEKSLQFCALIFQNKILNIPKIVKYHNKYLTNVFKIRQLVFPKKNSGF